MKSIKNKNKGFTLIETLLYLGIFAIIILTLMAYFQETLFLYGKISDKEELLDNGNFAVTKISWYLQNAEAVNSPLPGQSADSLSLTMSDAEINPVVFFADNGIIKIQKSSDPAVAITSDKVNADSINFYNNSYGQVEDIVQVDLNLSSAVAYWQNSPVNLQTSIIID